MKIAVLNVPFRLPADETRWITVPPQGYGGIQWGVANIMDGLRVAGCELSLLGAPGSPDAPDLVVSAATDRDSVREWLADNKVDLVHDHSNDDLMPADCFGMARIGTFHLTGSPRRPQNCVYVSRAQRQAAGSLDAPVIRVAVNPDRYRFSREKQDYLLFLGRISRHKGAKEAVAFAAAAGLPIKVAGPAWEADYFAEVMQLAPQVTDYVGEVGGPERLELIAGARAILVMSQPVPGPFGSMWTEPGATVVSEAAVSGTPVISTSNGCLVEIVPGVGAVLSPTAGAGEVTAHEAERVLGSLPPADEVRAVALARWGHAAIAREYIAVYERAIHGSMWR